MLVFLRIVLAHRLSICMCVYAFSAVEKNTEYKDKFAQVIT